MPARTFLKRGMAGPKITVLSGGVGAARFLSGLVQVVPPETVTAVVNTGDDEIFFGLYISPDIDIVTYTLAGMINPQFGWGIAGDTFHCLEALGGFGHPTWFHLGDRDLATHIHRTMRMQQGHSLEEVTDEIRSCLGVKAEIVPMSNQRVRTCIDNGEEIISFQEYFVKRQAPAKVRKILYDGIENAAAAPGAVEAVKNADYIIIAPSNPFVSIGTILSIPGFRTLVAEASAPAAAVSPLIGGKAVKGPTAEMMAYLGYEVSTAGVAGLYHGLLDIMIIDEKDAHLRSGIENMGIKTAVTDTLMESEEKKKNLARTVLASMGFRT